MGQALADAVNFPQPPLDELSSARGVIAQVSWGLGSLSGFANKNFQMDKVTLEFSGKFVTYDGAELPW